MSSTLVNDPFDEGEHGQGIVDTPVHNLVYGATGWTDELDDEVIEQLVGIGALVLDETKGGWNIYVSVKGRGPV